VMTLKLRTDVKFTDGTPFNADAAAQNILRFRDGTSPNASNLANVEGRQGRGRRDPRDHPDAARPAPARLPGPERWPDGEPEAVRRLGRADRSRSARAPTSWTPASRSSGRSTSTPRTPTTGPPTRCTTTTW
jgi:hypothetical protein